MHYLLRFFENQHKKAQSQFFLACLLVLFLEGWSCFYLVALVAFLGFILDLTIGGEILTEGDLAVSLSG